MIITCRLKEIRNLGNFNSSQYEMEVQDNVRFGETESQAYERLYGFLNTKMNTHLLNLGNSIDIGLFRSEFISLLHYFDTKLLKEELNKTLEGNNYHLKNIKEYQIADIVKMKSIVRKLILDIENREELCEDEEVVE